MSLRSPLSSIGSSAIDLEPGQSWQIPAGRFVVDAGRYCTVQRVDPVSQVWLPIVGTYGGVLLYVASDGQNYRVSNQTGCPVLAVLTAAGSGYTSAPLVTPSSGGSKWQAIMGSVVSTLTVVNPGRNYIYPPLVQIQAPPFGYPATANATISGGTVTGLTMTNQGAGYITPPAVSLMPDQRELTGSGAAAVANISNSGGVTGVVCTEHFGGALPAAGTVPTLSFSGGGGSGAAATAVMVWTISSLTITNAGAGYDPNTIVGIRTIGTGMPTPTPVYLNPRFEGVPAYPRARDAKMTATTGATGAITAIQPGDAGILGGVAQNIRVFIDSTAVPSTLAVLTIVPGGQSVVAYAVSA